MVRSRRILSLLETTAQNHPDQGIIFYEHGLQNSPSKVTYMELLREARDNARKLRQAEIISPGQKVIVYFENHRHNILWTWSIIAGGAIPAILSPLSNDPKTSQGQLENVIDLFDGPTLVTTSSLVTKFEDVPGLKIAAIEDVGCSSWRTSNGSRDLHCNGNSFANDQGMTDGGDDDHSSHANLPDTGDVTENSLAVLLFTSGSTGHSKAVEFTHKQLICSVRAKQKLHSITSIVNFMSWTSFDHSVNFCELHLNAMFSGSNQVHLNVVDLAQQPSLFFDMLHKEKIGYTFLPNFFLAAATTQLLRQEDTPDYDLSSLRVLVVGGESNRSDNIRNADAILRKYQAPKNSIKVVYGLSETCSACVYNVETSDIRSGYEWASVGKPLPKELELRIVDGDCTEKPIGESGHIQLRGDVVFQKYYNNFAATKSCTTHDGWFDTGDIGELDLDGNLHIVGRLKDILIINGTNYSSFELEYAIESRDLPGIERSYTATFSIWDPKANSEGVVVLFNPTEEYSMWYNIENLHATIRAIDHAVIGFCSKRALDIVPLPKMEMPKSTIGKLSRQKLKKFHADGAFDKYRVPLDGMMTAQTKTNTAAPPPTSMQKIIAEAIAKEASVSLESLSPNSSVVAAGADSLTFLRIKRNLEDAFNLQELPLKTLLFATDIRDLETQIKSLAVRGKAVTAYEPIVPLQKGGSKQPLILVHPGAGETLIWMGLVKYLPDRPIYGLRMRGWEAGETVFRTMEEMLNTYESAIRHTQPHGPYVLLGVCFGGNIAFELGKRLEASGELVIFCGGIDFPPDTAFTTEDPKTTSVKDFTFNLLESYDLIETSEERATLETEYADTDDEIFYQSILTRWTVDKLAVVNMSAAKLRRAHNCFMSIVHMLLQPPYKCRGKVTNFDQFWAPPPSCWGESKEVWRRRIYGWENHAHNACFFELEGNHFNLLRGPQLYEFQKMFKARLAVRGVD